MFTRQETINVIENQIKKQNNANVEKYQEILKKRLKNIMLMKLKLLKQTCSYKHIRI